jgi:hypothetical protein
LSQKLAGLWDCILGREEKKEKKERKKEGLEETAERGRVEIDK